MKYKLKYQNLIFYIFWGFISVFLAELYKIDIFSPLFKVFREYTFYLIAFAVVSFLFLIINQAVSEKNKTEFFVECEFNLPQKLLVKFVIFYLILSITTYLLLLFIKKNLEIKDYPNLIFFIIFLLGGLFISFPLKKTIDFVNEKMIFTGNFFGCELDKKEIQEICRDDVYLIMKLKNGETHKLKAPETYLKNRGKEKQMERLKNLITEIEKQWQISVPDCI